ncbi:Uncharacterised protein [Citrobacter freundii]|nr:Uncharacterised protein [Citrobacter freundii]
MTLEGRIIGVAFRAAAIEAFGALRIQLRFTLQTRNQIRVSDIGATKSNGVDQAFLDQCFCFFQVCRHPHQ